MDSRNFDAVVRACAGAWSRRRVLAALAGAWSGGSALLTDTEARRKRRKRKRCKKGLKTCGKRCVDIQTNADHCGACKASCGGRACVNGVCQNPGAGGCPAGQTRCGQACVNLQTDANHCGACRVGCSSGQACAGGLCAPVTCGSGERLCANLGRCIPADDPNRCCVDRDCGGAHQNPYGDLACTAEGRCVCNQPGEGRCTGTPGSSRNFQCDVCCGDGVGCPEGQICATAPNVLGCECDLQHGYRHCADGCKDTQNDSLNCGGCGLVCHADQSICQVGVCCAVTGQTCSESFPDGCCSRFCGAENRCAPCSATSQCQQQGLTAEICTGGRCCRPTGAVCGGPGYPCCSGVCVASGVGYICQ
ncbi:MAG: hypothetical protein KC432_02435 [Thermomicrobiales bacterium]|nr:hypothetical protein [Thermomicrobiales bacterium]